MFFLKKGAPVFEKTFKELVFPSWWRVSCTVHAVKMKHTDTCKCRSDV